jgi:TatD DNase family protein
VVAIGETGLDYYRLKGDLEWQRERFRTHIRAARRCGKPLIIHTREAAADTLRILERRGRRQGRGVFHCFTETIEVAEAALDWASTSRYPALSPSRTPYPDQGSRRSFVPLDRLLVETDAPYLAPVPIAES